MEPAIWNTLDVLNGPRHREALLVFLTLVLSHWVEHIVQAVQIFVLGWPRYQALGALGLLFPWLVGSETLHYWYALVTLVGLIALRPAFGGPARGWWDAAIAIQIWHHAEHALLLGQVLIGRNLFGARVPTSVLQLFFPRVELHLAYNAAVFIPMIIAMYLHAHPSLKDRRLGSRCNCHRRLELASG
ncbi:MAG TPA: hypothetical protein VKT83_06065 [bacterium]|nr:hypothetical protein [bacterium]